MGRGRNIGTVNNYHVRFCKEKSNIIQECFFHNSFMV